MKHVEHQYAAKYEDRGLGFVHPSQIPGVALSMLRRKAGLSIQQIAERLDTEDSIVRKIEQAMDPAPYSTLRRIVSSIADSEDTYYARDFFDLVLRTEEAMRNDGYVFAEVALRDRVGSIPIQVYMTEVHAQIEEELSRPWITKPQVKQKMIKLDRHPLNLFNLRPADLEKVRQIKERVEGIEA